MHWGWLRLPPNGPDVCRGVSSLEMVVGRGRAACGIVSSISNWSLDGWWRWWWRRRWLMCSWRSG